MALLFPSLLVTYSLCWYGVFHLLNSPPTENVLVYYLSLSHLILSFAYLLFIHPLNMWVGSDVGDTRPTRCLKAHESVAGEANHVSVEMVNLPETASMRKRSTTPRITTSNYIVSCLMNQSLDNEALHRKAKLTKSVSFPAATSSRMRRQVPTKLDHKQREIWPPSQSANSTANSLAKLMRMLCEDSKGSSSKKEIKRYVSRRSKPRVCRRGLSLSELDYNDFLPNMDVYREAASGEIGVEDDSVASPWENRDEITTAIGMCNTKLLTSEVFQSQSTSKQGKEENVQTSDQFSPMEMEDDEEFYYVKHVLDLSGLIKKDQVWYSLEQPLNPDLFEEIETHYCDLDLLKSSIKVDDSKQDRRLIFDLINEALVYVNERPYSYYPKALSCKCHLHPVPKEQHLLEEVRAFVGRSLNWIPNLDTLLESAVHESNWNGGWMNLQIESEIAALEVEDLILDELLDEILLC